VKRWIKHVLKRETKSDEYRKEQYQQHTFDNNINSV
jgi:hypothetical protein